MCVCVCVMREERGVSAEEESAQCSVKDSRQGTQRVLRQSLSISLSLSEYNPFHSLQGRAANEAALSLPHCLHYPLVLYLSFAHEP